MDATSISVIIPVLGEAERIRALVHALGSDPGLEVIVVDGDPAGSTIGALADMRCRSLVASPGRASQMNAGAVLAGGEILLFLHADTRLPEGWAAMVRRLVGNGFTRCGAFGLRFRQGGPMGAVAGRWAGLRSRLDRRPYGDQAQFFTASFFHELGGYAPIPIMEDVEIMRRAVQQGHPPSILDCNATTSARRYRSEGWLKRGIRNMGMRMRFALGTSAEQLAGGYRPHGKNRKHATKRDI